MMDYVVEGATLDLFQGVAGQRLGCLVHVDALLAFIHEEDRDRGVVEHGIEAALARTEAFGVLAHLQCVLP